MVAVNLLPWRQRRRQQQQRHSLVVLIVLTSGLLLVATQQAWQIHEAQQRTAREKRRLQQAVESLAEQRVLQTQLLEQIALLQTRQQQRRQRALQLAAWQQFWLDLPALLPDTAWLTRLEKRERRLTLEGQAQDMADIRHFRQQLARVALLEPPEQGAVKRQADGRYRFSLRAQVREVRDE
ncbi:PilN domain-containing protein [Pantoea sp. C2G6]|uniref:PilN domain-containing protein n=1 Tax=Pantoea sp. C2G6 TaxID=3243084 RepID=UPI003ED9EEA0